MFSNLAVRSATTLAVALSCGLALSQDYPHKPIRIVTGGVAGITDTTARLAAQGLIRLGQQVIVENRPSGVIPVVTVAKAAPDGYTLLIGGDSMAIEPLIKSAPYDIARDFTPISLVSTAPNILVMHPSLPVKSVRELIALAKAKPSELNYASGPTASATHLAAELFNAMAQVKIVRIPYNSGSSQMADLVGGHVLLTFGTAATVTPYIKSRRLTRIAVTSAQQTPLAPGMQTIAASGLPGYESTATLGLWAPAKTPEALIIKINQELIRFLQMSETKAKFLLAGMDPAGNSPAEYSAQVAAKLQKLSPVIKALRDAEHQK